MTTTVNLLTEIEAKLLHRQEQLTVAEALALTELDNARLPELMALAHKVRLVFCGEGVELESLINAKMGGCPEDCAFCSQSSRFESPLQIQPLLKPEEVLAAAKDTEAKGATQFCIVVAVRGPGDGLMRQVLKAIDLIQAETSLRVDCSLGILTREQAMLLKEKNIYHYNHNLETARSFFPTIVTSHTWEERAETCRLIKEVGLGLCSGGIFGMGESWAQRIEFASQLRELNVDEIPLNFLIPQPGTPFANAPLLQPLDALKICAIFRLFFPAVTLRYAGGRELILRDLQAFGLLGGVNALIVGNYLTTTGRPAEEDLRMLSDLGMSIKP